MLNLTLVEPYLSYCCIVWADIDKTLCLDRIIHKIQKHSLTLEHSAPLFKKLKILNIYSLFRFQASLYMHKHIMIYCRELSLIFNSKISILISPAKVKTYTKYCPEHAVDNIHLTIIR